MHPEVIVVGSYVQDLIFSCEKFPAAGQTVIGRFNSGPGGKGSNQAVAAVRAGASTTFIGAIGADAFGEAARAFHNAEGIGCRMVEKSGHPTATAAIIVNGDGQNKIIVALGANESLAPEDLDPALFGKARVVVTQLEANLAAAAHALKLARASKVLTVLNPAPMREDFDAGMLAAVDVLIPNETEFATLVNRLKIAPGGPADEFDETQIHRMEPTDLHVLCRKFGVATLILTLGSRGCFVSRDDGTHELVPAQSGVRVTDTTGAGDAFVGAFAAGYVRFEGDLIQAVKYANLAAAISVTRAGAAPAMPRRAEIDAAFHS